jgi:PhoPQ-activated pathogenicity-related protein
MCIVRPKNIQHTTALLSIGGGNSEKPGPKEADALLVKAAIATESIVCELKLVPNQPLIFGGDDVKRQEDDIIAYTWNKYLRTGDDRWPAQLAMTKSAVRAMDTVIAICQTNMELKIDSFVVTGASKRGWTTWTTAAVDPRVKAIIPCVIDLLNMEPSFRHHWDVYGFWAPAVHDYVDAGIMEWQGTPEYRKLMRIVEPYEYRERLTMPKFIINAMNDQFFVPDSSQFYFKDLPSVKYIRYIPNADHSLKHSDAGETLITLYWTLLNNKPLPRFTWTTDPDGALRVKTQDKPASVKLWQVTNPKTRDFRLDTLGATPCTSTDLKDEGEGLYIGRVPKPAEGWTAYMIELTFPQAGAPAPLKFTTQVNVLPDVTPFKFETQHPAQKQ